MSELLINEMFLSIQGESSWAGWPCAFVRTTGCPLRCRWCDTAYAYEQGQTMAIAQIVSQVLAWGVSLVEVTGGEPLAQVSAPELLSALCDQGLTVLLETGGSLDIAAVDSRVHIILDIKCPSSGMSQRMLWTNLELLKPRDEAKFVLADRQDYEYARQLVEKHKLNSGCQVLFSTVFGQIEPSQVVAWILEDRLPVRFQLQMHKYIWPPETRGV
ncbi:MAG: radical SAM protein [Desulfarculaceae bacterium]